MKDFLGNELSVGDPVVFIVPGYRELSKGFIVRLTPQMAFISRDKTHGQTRATWQDTIKQFHNQIVKITS